MLERERGKKEGIISQILKKKKFKEEIICREQRRTETNVAWVTALGRPEPRKNNHIAGKKTPEEQNASLISQ